MRLQLRKPRFTPRPGSDLYLWPLFMPPALQRRIESPKVLESAGCASLARWRAGPDPACDRFRHGFKLDTAPKLHPVLADPYQLEVALLNLVVNARDAMDKRGTERVAANGNHTRTGRMNDTTLSLRVDTPSLAAAVEQLDLEQINTLPFGAIRLNPEFKVIFYSDVERRLSGYRKDAVDRR